MIKDKLNKLTISEIEGKVSEDYIDLFKIHSNKIVFVKNPTLGFRDTLAIKSNEATYSLMEKDFIALDFIYNEENGEDDEFKKYQEIQQSEDVFELAKNFLETEDRILYVFIEHTNLIDEKRYVEAREILHSAKLTPMEKTSRIMIFPDNYEENSISGPHSAATINKKIEEELKSKITYDDAIELKDMLLKSRPADYNKEVSNKVLCTILNEIIVSKELASE